MQASALWTLVQALLALIGTLAVFWLLMRLLTRVTPRGSITQRLHLLDRLVLDARRSVYVVRIDARVLALGVGEGGAPALLAELDGAAWPAATTPSPLMPPAWRAKLEKLTRKDS